MREHHICIVGGSGFVGHHLAARLVRDGHTVRIPTRRFGHHRDLLVLPGVELVECDVYNDEALLRLFSGCDVVINLAGILNERGHNGRGFYRVHVELAHKIVCACQDSGIHRLLHMSALGGDAEHGASYYQRSKGAGEELVHQAKDLAVTSFRPSVIFGPGDSFFNRFARLLKQFPLALPLACGASRFAPVYVGDVVECYARAIDNRACWGQRYELCGPRSYPLRQLVEYTANQLGLRRYILSLPRWASWLQALVLEFVPGKPFSRDNYLSMRHDNVCSSDFPPIFAITPRSIESVVPGYLSAIGTRRQYDEFRSRAGRD